MANVVVVSIPMGAHTHVNITTGLAENNGISKEDMDKVICGFGDEAYQLYRFKSLHIGLILDMGRIYCLLKTGLTELGRIN